MLECSELVSKRILSQWVFCFIGLFIVLEGHSQYQNDSLNFQIHYQRSKELNTISLFAESIKELEIAIDLAKDNENLAYEYLDARITMGEMMRRTGDQRRGLEVLELLTESHNFPKLHARKCGRIAALYMEGGDAVSITRGDSAYKYLEEGLRIARENNLKEQEATICNSFGVLKNILEGPHAGRELLERSAELFLQIKDTNNYVVAMCHVMHQELLKENFEKADKMGNNLLKMVQGHEWYGTEQSLCRNFMNRYYTVGDTVNALRWENKVKDAAAKLLVARSNNEMSFYRVQYDTDKYQKNALEAKLETASKQKDLDSEKKSNKLLMIFLGVSGILICGVIYFYFKQQKLAKKLSITNSDLEISNQNYQMLMVESNHRIKNNLQMIISMLEYASQDVKQSGPEAFKKISSKIQVISALHKYLYSDVHNEFVQVSDYFGEIIELYGKISSEEIEIIPEIGSVEIKSERIVYFGLIFNELLANSLEHNMNQEILAKIKIYPLKDRFVFDYCDNSELKNESKVGTGTILIQQLVKRVKGKDYKVDSASGRYTFTFDATI